MSFQSWRRRSRAPNNSEKTPPPGTVGEAVQFLRYLRRHWAIAIGALAIVAAGIVLKSRLETVGKGDWFRDSVPAGVRQQCKDLIATRDRVAKAVALTQPASCATDWGQAQQRLTRIKTIEQCKKARQADRICIVDDQTTFDEAMLLTDLRTEMWRRNYLSANSVLQAALHDTLDKPATEGRIIPVSGPAGSGKSWVITGLLRDAPKSGSHGAKHFESQSGKIVRFDDIVKWLSGRTTDLDYSAREQFPPLQTSLPGDVVAADKDLQPLIEEMRAETDVSMWIVDSLDEIHPDVRPHVFAAIASVLDLHPKLHVYLMGRPEAFKRIAVFRDRTDAKLLPPLELKYPIFTSTEDIAIRWNNYVLWRFVKGERGKPPVPINKNTSFESTVDILRSSPTVCSSFGQAMIGAFVIADGQEWFSGDKQRALLSEDEIRQRLLEEILRRNEESHSRPGVSGGANIYLKSLQHIAAHGLGLMGPGGKFKPLVATVWGGAPSNVTILDHSGLISLDPGDNETYFYTPWWVPLELIRRETAELNDSYKELGCRL